MPTNYGFDPGTSPWERILPAFIWVTSRTDLENIFGGIRDFVVAAAASPALGNRNVYPSTINMTIFKTAEPVVYSEDYLHPRVIVSPRGREYIRVRYYLGQKEKPEKRWTTPLPDEPGRMRLRVQGYVSGRPEPVLERECDPHEGIEIIRRCFGG